MHFGRTGCKDIGIIWSPRIGGIIKIIVYLDTIQMIFRHCCLKYWSGLVNNIAFLWLIVTILAMAPIMQFFLLAEGRF